MLDTLQQSIASLMQTLVYLIGYGLLILVGYAIGYFVSTRRKTVTAESQELEPEITFLSNEIARAKTAAGELLERMEVRSSPSQRNEPWTAKSDEGKRPNWMQRPLDALRLKFKQRTKSHAPGSGQNPGEPDAAPDNELVLHLKNLKQDVIDITEHIKTAKLWVNPKSTQGNTKSASDAEKKDASGDYNSYFGSKQEKASDETVERQIPIVLRRQEEQPPQVKQSGSGSTITGTAREAIELYNRAVTDSMARDRFREQYLPIRVGTVNAVERRQNPTIDPEFKETSDGAFFAIPIANQDMYAVFPRLGLTIEAVNYNAGALGQVFGNPAYDSKQFYSRYQVRKPAIFRRGGDHWKFETNGDLDLGQGE